MSQEQVYVYIDSCDKLAGSISSSNFQFRINIPKNKQYKKVALVQSSFLKGYYMIDGTNNTFEITDSAGTNTVTLESGRDYSIVQLISEVAAKMTAVGDTYTGSFNPNSAKISLSNGVGAFSIDLTNNRDLARYLGLNAGVSVSVADEITSTKIIDAQRYCSIQIRSSLCRNGIDNILEQLLIRDTAGFDAFHLEPTQRNWKTLIHPESDMHSIWITDAMGQSINLNGAEMQITLCFSQ
jgi:hypothetical protein